MKDVEGGGRSRRYEDEDGGEFHLRDALKEICMR